MAIGQLVRFIFSRKTPGQIDNIVLDATLSENHDYTNKVTSFPVETGADITDHIVQEPERLTIEGFVTNTPVSLLGNLGSNYVTTLRAGITQDESLVLAGQRVENALTRLLELAGYPVTFAKKNKLTGASKGFFKRELGKTTGGGPPKVFEVFTGLRAYDSMAIESLSIPRDNKMHEAIKFTLVVKKVRFTDTVFTEGVPEATVSEDTEASEGAKKVAPSRRKQGKVPTSALRLTTDSISQSAQQAVSNGRR